MKRFFLLIALLLTALMALPPNTARAGNEVSFSKNLDLLRVEMKLKLLEKLFGLGFYIRPKLVAGLQEEQRQLLVDINGSAAGDFRGLDQWHEQQVIVARAEDLEMQKLVEKWGKKALQQASATRDEVLKFDALVNQWRRSDKTRALDMARAMEQILKDKLRVPSGRDYTNAALQLYGAFIDTDDLVGGLVKLQKERTLLEASRASLAEIQSILGRIDDFEKATPDSIKEKIDKVVIEHLQANFTVFDPKIDGPTIANLTSQLKTIGEKGYEVWSNLAKLDKDRHMNPSVRRAAKTSSVMGTIYSYVFGLVKNLDETNAAGPIGQILTFYGAVLASIPTLAQSMSAMTERMDQDYLDNRLLNSFSQTVPQELGPFHTTSVRNKFGIDLGFGESGGNIVREEVADKFYLIVPTDVMPRGYASLSREQYERLADALADERLANAFDEASRSLSEFLEHNRFNPQVADPLAPTAASSYLASLKTAATTSPLNTSKELVALAQGMDNRPAGWITPRNKRIESLAEELTIREALNRFRESDRLDWHRFTDMLTTANVPLAPPQILHLFNFYMRNPNSELLQRYLEKERKTREDGRMGVPHAGIPDVSVVDPDTAKPGKTITVTADVIVSRLAPGRKLEAELTWTFPDWARPETVRQNLSLTNGLKTTQVSLSLPSTLSDMRFPVTVELKAAYGDREIATRNTSPIDLSGESQRIEPFSLRDSASATPLPGAPAASPPRDDRVAALPRPAPAPVAALDQQESRWKVTFDGKWSIWTFTLVSPGQYQATEDGLGRAKGTATYDEASQTLTLQAVSQDKRYAATYQWTTSKVDSGVRSGTIKFTVHGGKVPPKPVEYAATLEPAPAKN